VLINKIAVFERTLNQSANELIFLFIGKMRDMPY